MKVGKGSGNMVRAQVPRDLNLLIYFILLLFSFDKYHISSNDIMIVIICNTMVLFLVFMFLFISYIFFYRNCTAPCTIKNMNRPFNI